MIKYEEWASNERIVNAQSTRDIVHTVINTGIDEPSSEIATCVAELEGREPEELAPMYDCVDDVLKNLFDQPRAAEAQMQVEFNYEGYRITVDQVGLATVVDLGATDTVTGLGY